MKRMFTGLAVTVALATMVGCSDSVSTVKNGTMEAHPQGTIGDVFAANFDDGKWISEKKDGKDFVTFTGKISQKLHDREFSKIKFYLPLVQNDNCAFAKELSTIIEAETINEKFELKKTYDDLEEKRKEVEECLNKIHNFEYIPPPEVSQRLEELNLAVKNKEEEVRNISDKIRQSYSGEDNDLENRIQYRNALEKEEKLIDVELDKMRNNVRKIESEIESEKQKIIIPLSKNVGEKRIDLEKIQKKQDTLYKEIPEKTEACKAKMYPILAHKYWWPAGSEVEFKWIVYPDGKKFEINSVANSSWGEYKMSISDILDSIYGE